MSYNTHRGSYSTHQGRRRVRHYRGGWQATCPGCTWRFWSRSLPSAYTEAWHHTCRPVLGPRMLPPGSSIRAVETSTAVYVEPPPFAWHRPEVWW